MTRDVYSLRTLKVIKVRGSTGDICDKICLGYCYYLWFFKWIRRKKRQEDGGKIKSHTQTHPRRPTLTKNNHLLALTRHARPKLKVQHNTTAFEPESEQSTAKHDRNAPRHSPRRPQDTEQRRKGGGGVRRPSGWVVGKVIQYVCMQQLISTCFHNHPGRGSGWLIQEETVFSVSHISG